MHTTRVLAFPRRVCADYDFGRHFPKTYLGK